MPSQGIYDGMPGSAFEEEDENTVPPPTPVDPSPQVAVQLSVAEPPVDDPDFIPGSVEELALAANTLSKEVPADEIEWYYRQLHKLVTQANDRDLAGPDAEEVEEVEEEVTMQEEAARRIVRNALREVLTPEEEAGLGFTPEEEAELDRYRSGDTDDYSTAGIDYFGDAEPEPEPAEPEGMSLEDLAQEFGYSGPSGIRQEINRITSKMEYFVQKISQEDLDALMSFAATEYIEVLGDTGALDAADLSDLRAAPKAVQELDSFRFFFVSAFVLPAYKEVAKEAAKELEARIADLALPPELNLTVLNQLSGRAKRSPAVIRRKLDKLVTAGTVAAEEAAEIASKIESAVPVLTQAAELSDDLLDKALDKWESTSKKKRARLLDKAMEETAGM